MAKKCFKGYDETDVFAKEAFGVYTQQFSDYDTVHAMCEDYRASMQEDIEEQKADEQARKKMTCPLRVLWGKKGVIEAKFNAVNEWRKVCDNVDQKSCALNSGHYIPEEDPQGLLHHINDFFT